ncbi:MAG: rRNA maturation RNase YbeY [Patescibacteria group bacterium]|nr:rRNA maturation RNase YbeY [Patescibacteria group bacterium]MDD5164061.1 rRNA maturation RNase YbeY [Patescibacteria group bacterium]MDD5534855.1 rRNA maturation RNase YbeY [Patescibacteria group bacterium]
MIIEINKLIKFNLSKNFIKLILKRILKETAKKIPKIKNIDSFSVVFTNEKTIQAINKKYRKINKATDVLSFSDPAEIIICWSQLKKQAKEFKHTQIEELKILLVHSVLHILGHDHRFEKEKNKMDKLANQILRVI